MRGLLSWAGLAILANAQHLGLNIPEVEHDVQAALSKYSKYVHYTAPPHAAKPTPADKPVPQASAAAGSCDYWLNEIPHNGVAAFNSDSSYQVFRNVRDFGATGNGVTDDTAAINSAISSGGRCAPGSCQSSTLTPAVVYFPPGEYLISSSIIDYYYTQLIGNPNCLPTIKASSDFSGDIGLIDADPYQSGGAQGYGSTNVFWRQIRNFILDTTAVPASSSITGIHWPTAQATSIQNVQFQMSSASGTQHQGIFIENGSAGFLSDLTFVGGLYGLNVGNQQYTMRNLVFENQVTAINQIWDWGWTYQGLTISNATNGIVMTGGGTSDLSVGSVIIIDSKFTDVENAVVADRTGSQTPAGANQIILENIQIDNVGTVVSNNGATALGGTGGSETISAWGQGISYTPSGPNNFQGNIPVAGNGRPASLTSGGNYFTMEKPQYNTQGSSNVLTVRSYGATGNGNTDDTTAFQNAINAAVSSGKLLFVDQGDYLVSKTLSFPPGLKITGEAYPVILGSGSFFGSMSSPQPVVQIGTSGQSGSIQWSNMIVSTKGAAPGAILIEYNLNSGSSNPSGIWDVHTRIGGFAGSDLQVANCPTTPSTTVTSSNLNQNCIAAFMSMYVTSASTGLYMENNWLWNADHDVDNSDSTQVTVYSGRGLLIESAGPVWLFGTAVEHHTLYQYQFNGAKDVFAGFIQTETPYYQPNPGASIPFPAQSSLNDPVFASGDSGLPSTTSAWGLRIVNSQDILIYGAGHYSFFDNQSTSCSDQGTDNCQESIVDLSGNTDVTIYGLTTVGVQNALTEGSSTTGNISNEEDGFEESIAWYTSNT